jgi:hypothetical protein
VLPTLDYRVLLGFLTLILVTFVATWVASGGFMPGARLFPYYLAAAGTLITLLAIIRAALGVEPSRGPGQVLPSRDDDATAAYRKSAAILGGIALYFVGVLLVGFMVSTAIYIVTFLRFYDQSYLYGVLCAAGALTFVSVLNWALDLHLPMGWLYDNLLA